MPNKVHPTLPDVLPPVSSPRASFCNIPPSDGTADLCRAEMAGHGSTPKGDLQMLDASHSGDANTAAFGSSGSVSVGVSGPTGNPTCQMLHDSSTKELQCENSCIDLSGKSDTSSTATSTVEMTYNEKTYGRLFMAQTWVLILKATFIPRSIDVAVCLHVRSNYFWFKRVVLRSCKSSVPLFQ